MQGRRIIAREGDQADAGVVVAQACCRRNAVEKRHVKIQDYRVGVELLRELDRLDPVDGRCDDLELGLPVDQLPERGEVGAVVICYQDPDRLGGGVRRGVHWRQS